MEDPPPPPHCCDKREAVNKAEVEGEALRVPTSGEGMCGVGVGVGVEPPRWWCC